MNKYLFWLITLLFALFLIFMTEAVGISYLMGDKYQLPEEPHGEPYLTVQEFKDKLENEEEVLTGNFPFEFQLLYIKVYFVKIVAIVFVVLITAAIWFIIKDTKIDFSVMRLSPKERKINTARITMYIMTLIIAFTTSQAYPATFLYGWIMVFIWIAAILILMVWVLNALVALKINKEQKTSGKMQR